MAPQTEIVVAPLVLSFLVTLFLIIHFLVFSYFLFRFYNFQITPMSVSFSIIAIGNSLSVLVKSLISLVCLFFHV